MLQSSSASPLACTSTPNTHWKVVWDSGTTEGGSSGSPFFNENGLVIGQLHGGGASCTNTSSPDYYGKISESWTKGLSLFLDPNSIGFLTLEGMNLNQLFSPNSPTCADIECIMCQWGELNSRGGENCSFCDANHTIHDENWKNKSNTKRANNSITAREIKINNNSSIRFEAREFITLEAPFSVDASSSFLGIIGSCFCDCPWTCLFTNLGCTGLDQAVNNNTILSRKMLNNNQINSVAKNKLDLNKAVFKIYPNPSRGIFEVELGEGAYNQIQIIDFLGRQYIAVKYSATVWR